MTGVQTRRAAPSLRLQTCSTIGSWGRGLQLCKPCPSERLRRPGRRPESRPPSTPSFHPEGTGHRVLAERLHHPARQFQREKVRKPQPWPQPGRTSASCSHWYRPPAPPRSSAGRPGPTWPCLCWRRGLRGEQKRATELGVAAVTLRLGRPRFPSSQARVRAFAPPRKCQKCPPLRGSAHRLAQRAPQRSAQAGPGLGRGRLCRKPGRGAGLWERGCPGAGTGSRERSRPRGGGCGEEVWKVGRGVEGSRGDAAGGGGVLKAGSGG